jgi:LysR family glycine cleavage system transcriptional activator
MPGPSPAAPLRALQAFSAVARAGSVVGAAEELAVTPSAISHLVRQLERRLGVVLLTRKGRGLTLTLDGERLAAAVGPALVTIDDALGGLMRRGAELRISLLSSFAVHWLIPRLSRFQSQHPNIELLLSTSTRIVDLTAEAFDCAIRLGRGGWPNVMADELYREELVAACSPHWLAAHRIRTPRDLARAALLHARARRQDWVHWFRAAGIPDFKARRSSLHRVGVGRRPTYDAFPAPSAARQRLLARMASWPRNGTTGCGVPSMVGSRGGTRSKTIAQIASEYRGRRLRSRHFGVLIGGS